MTDDVYNPDDERKEECLPDLGKDDMHARRTGQFQKIPGGGVMPVFNLFLPVPGSVKFKSTPTPTSSPLSPSLKPVEPASDTHRSEGIAPLYMQCFIVCSMFGYQTGCK